VAATLFNLGIVFLSPWQRFLKLAWMLNFFAALCALSNISQIIHMYYAVHCFRKICLKGSSNRNSSSSTSRNPVKHTIDTSSSKRSASKLSRKQQPGDPQVQLIPAFEWQQPPMTQTKHLTSERKWHHVFVIPNYEEELPTLRATLDQLASHPRASSCYTILLAMESKDAGASQKARSLQKHYAHSFCSVISTLHELAHEEMPGKASNVNAAVRLLYKTGVPADPESTMLTIIDAGGELRAVLCILCTSHGSCS
jgi:hypothetical protein